MGMSVLSIKLEMSDCEPSLFALIVRNGDTFAGGVFINNNIPDPIIIVATNITKHLTVRDRSVGANFVSYAERTNLIIHIFTFFGGTRQIDFSNSLDESLFDIGRTVLMVNRIIHDQFLFFPFSTRPVLPMPLKRLFVQPVF